MRWPSPASTWRCCCCCCALILRPVGFKFRSKLADARWREIWDWALFVGGLVPALVFGVAFGNVLQGVPFRFDDTLRMTYEGNLFGLFNPFALLCGLVSVAMLTMHGASLARAARRKARCGDRAQRAGMHRGAASGGAVRARRILGRAAGRLCAAVISPASMRPRIRWQAGRAQAGALMANYGRMPLDHAGADAGHCAARCWRRCCLATRRRAGAGVPGRRGCRSPR